MRTLRRFYGAHPLHLLALLGCFALAGYAALRTTTESDWPLILVWFLAAVIGHDLVLFPLYALADRALHALGHLLPKRRSAGRPLVPPLNYVRVPALGTGLTLLLFLPGIIRQGTATYLSATGLTQQPFLGRWLLLSAAMFGVSAVAYAIRSRIAAAPARAAVAEVRALLHPGERVLTFAYRDRTAGAVAATGALYHRDGTGWQRLAWADIGEVTWAPEDQLLTVTGFNAPEHRTEIPLTDPADLVEVASALVAATIVVTTSIELPGAPHTLLTVRRRADSLVWWVRLGQGVDPEDPRLRADVDTALAAVRADLGLPGD